MGLQTEIAEWLEEYTPKHNRTDSGWIIIPEVAKERYKQDANQILAKMREVVEGVELPDTICPIDDRSCVGGEPARQAILKAMED